MEGRGLSLRKKRSVKPKISAPRQISAPLASPPPNQSQSSLVPPSIDGRSVSAKSSQSSLNSQRTRRQATGNTADYVKRRYSTRITQAPQDFNPPSLPALPDNFLAQPPARSARPAGSSHDDKVAVDLKALQDPQLQADQCKRVGCRGPVFANSLQMSQGILRMQQSRRSKTTNTI